VRASKTSSGRLNWRNTEEMLTKPVRLFEGLCDIIESDGRAGQIRNQH
jgi:hypothetical protein